MCNLFPTLWRQNPSRLAHHLDAISTSKAPRSSEIPVTPRYSRMSPGATMEESGYAREVAWAPQSYRETFRTRSERFANVSRYVRHVSHSVQSWERYAASTNQAKPGNHHSKYCSNSRIGFEPSTFCKNSKMRTIFVCLLFEAHIGPSIALFHFSE